MFLGSGIRGCCRRKRLLSGTIVARSLHQFCHRDEREIGMTASPEKEINPRSSRWQSLAVLVLCIFAVAIWWFYEAGSPTSVTPTSVTPTLPAAAQEKYPAQGTVRISDAILAPFLRTRTGWRGIMGCRDPANTLLWISIVSGRLYEREVQDGTQRRRIGPTQRDVMNGLEGFKPLVDHIDCNHYSDGFVATIEAEGVWGGIKMLCLKTSRYNIDSCFWAPASEIDQSPRPASPPPPPKAKAFWDIAPPAPTSPEPSLTPDQRCEYLNQCGGKAGGAK
jgi:hypothetical protein